MSDTIRWVAPLVIGVALIVGGAYLYVSYQQATENATAVDAAVLSSEGLRRQPR